MKKTVTLPDGRIFDCHCGYDGCMVDVTIHRVTHPDRKRFFRSKFFPTYATSFFIDDYESIDDCIESALRTMIYREKRDEERAEKIQKFRNQEE